MIQAANSCDISKLNHDGKQISLEHVRLDRASRTINQPEQSDAQLIKGEADGAMMQAVRDRIEDSPQY